jgi:hypothetical protein
MSLWIPRCEIYVFFGSRVREFSSGERTRPRVLCQSGSDFRRLAEILLYSTKEGRWPGATDSARSAPPEKRRHSAAPRYEMEFRQAEYFRDRDATPAPSKSIHQETLLSVRRNVHRAIFRLRQKFCRHIQN